MAAFHLGRLPVPKVTKTNGLSLCCMKNPAAAAAAAPAAPAAAVAAPAPKCI